MAGAARRTGAAVDLATWTFRVFGEVEEALELTLGAVQRAAAHEIDAGHPLRHALEPLRREFEGVHWSEIAKLCRPTAERAVRDRPRRARLHRERRRSRSSSDDDALLVTHADGEPLTPDHGWPMRLVVPGKYFWKSAKWLRASSSPRVDQPGFWERYGYHNDADPWEEERYGF